jgi:hypothetical protein
VQQLVWRRLDRLSFCAWCPAATRERAFRGRWGASIPSREAAGLNVFGKTVARFEELAKSGRVHGHQEYFSVTGRNGGFMMIDGELDELMKILVEDETMKLTDQASAVVSDLEIQAFAGGNDRATQQLVTDYTTNLQEIGYM